MRRDMGGGWEPGYVTQVHPLRVSYSDDPDDYDGYEWDEVRKMDVSGVELEQELDEHLLRYEPGPCPEYWENKSGAFDEKYPCAPECYPDVQALLTRTFKAT